MKVMQGAFSLASANLWTESPPCRRAFSSETTPPPRPFLTNENDAGRLLLGQRKRIPDHLCAISDEHLNELRPRQLEERRIRLSSNGPELRAGARKGMGGGL